MRIYDPKAGNFATADVIKNKRLGTGKLNDVVAQFLYDIVLNGASDDTIGDDEFGLYEFIWLDPPVKVIEPDGVNWQLAAAIVWETDQGVVNTRVFKNREEAKFMWQDLEGEYVDVYEKEQEDLDEY